MEKKKSVKYLYNAIFASLLLAILFVPPVKILVIRGLMKIGLFSPDIKQTGNTAGLPAISIEYPDGKKRELTDFKGKVVFINFWATWCPPCTAEMPAIDQLHEQLKADTNIIFLMIDADHNFGKSIPFIQKHGYGLPLAQANSYVPDNILGSALPTTVVFDKTGKMVFRHEGMADYSDDKFAKYIKQLASAK